MTPVIHELPDGVLLAWYGDDFTGSAAVMDVLALAGLPGVLFVDLPTPELLARFAGCRGIGIAGVARSKSPQWMTEHLPPVFEALARLDAPITHYKVCSTLDSTPQVGSIGKAVELAEPYFSSEWIPLLVAAPTIKRYQLFANLFAAVDTTGYRLDRHPTMSRHPVTPMSEADVRLHLARQTTLPVGLIDYLALTGGCADAQLDAELTQGRRVVAIDVLDEANLVEAGRLIWERRGDRLFAVGSQGIEYALCAFWRSTGMLGAQQAAAEEAVPAERIAVVCGSCSPTSSRQISWAEANGFESIRLDVSGVVDERAWSRAVGAAAESAVQAFRRGRDPIVFTARGPDDPSIRALTHAVESCGVNPEAVNESIGAGLGEVLRSIFKETGVRRGVFAGGDTSGHGVRALGVRAFTPIAPIAPGGGLLRAHFDGADLGDLEIALKGGQMGSHDYFAQIKSGGRIRRGGGMKSAGRIKSGGSAA